MAKVLITESYLENIADAIRVKAETSDTFFPSEMASAIMEIDTGGSTINNQNKSVTPTESQQSITADSGYTGLGTVTVNAISSTYVGSGITRKSSTDLTVSGATVSVPAGYYSATASKSVASGSATAPASINGTTASISTGSGTLTLTKTVSVTPSVTAGYVSSGTAGNSSVSLTASVTIDPTPTASGAMVTIPAGYYSSQTTKSVTSGSTGTPTASKGTVSNHTISITPSVTNTTGYITGGTKTGTAVSVSASELVSGTLSVSTNGTKDVTNYASVNVNVGSTINNQDKSVTPTESQQLITADSDYTGLGTVTVGAISSTYVGSDIYRRSSSDLTASGATVSVPSGYYEENASKAVSSGSATGPSSLSGSSASITTSTNTITLTKTGITTTPTVSAGYISSATASTATVALTASVTVNPTLTVSGATVTAPAGYYSTSASQSVSSMTLPTAAASSATSGYTSKATIGRSIATQYINIPPGYNSAGAYYVISATPNGSVTAPSSISGTTATISTGNGTLTLTKTVSVTPNVTTAGYISSGTAGNSSVSLTANVTINPTPTASGATVTIPAGYYSSQTTKSVTSGSATAPASISDTAASVSTGTNTLTLTKTVSVTPTVSAGYVSSGTAGNSSVSLTANITTKAAATYHPSTTDQTISASQYLTGAQTIKAVTTTNLTAANIKKDVVVKIGDSTDDDCVTTITGTYEGSGGGAALTVDTSTATLSSAATSISFTGLAGEPTSFAVVSAAELATGASPWKTAAVVFDGTDLHGQTIRNTSNAQVTYDGSSFSKTYSNGTLTITGSGTNFQANQYKLVYTYGGSDIGTADVQVGSGATSITFTGLEEEPSYFSCIFKSNFSTSSGYQRVIVVVYDGTSTYGMEMDSSAKHSTAHWTYSYNSGSLTITSNGTNAGGYFHQPGYYQLTYAVEGLGGNYQTKSATYYATSSQQTASIAADSGYDALKKVNITIAPVTTTNLIASNIVSGVTVQVGDAVDSDRIASVTGNVVLQNYYTGSSAPSSSLGSNGDLYLQS